MLELGVQRGYVPRAWACGQASAPIGNPHLERPLSSLGNREVVEAHLPCGGLVTVCRVEGLTPAARDL
ncbi:MAG: hypothetical protein OXN89_15705 [Bryobacterales bacterium]|nr:hypothetical protein [Bryobacterales bacterium]